MYTYDNLHAVKTLSALAIEMFWPTLIMKRSANDSISVDFAVAVPFKDDDGKKITNDDKDLVGNINMTICKTAFVNLIFIMLRLQVCFKTA